MTNDAANDQGVVGGDVIPNDAPVQGTATPAQLLDAQGNLIKKQETWLREDWRHLVAAQKVANDRNVGVGMMCGGCGAPLLPTGYAGDGALAVECECTVRRWLR